MIHNDTVDFKYGFPVYCRQVVKSIRVNKLFAAKTVQTLYKPNAVSVPDQNVLLDW